MMPHGHTGLWPRPPRKPRERLIACFDGSVLTDEYGQAWEIDSWSELSRVAFDGGYDVYCSDFFAPDAFPYLLDAISDDHCTVLASPTGGVIGLSVRRGKYKRYLGLAATWRSEPGGAFARLLRRLFDYVGIGTYTTPGSFGEALWTLDRTERMSVPCEGAQNDLRDNLFGGRAETPGAGRKLAYAYELDLRSAYVALCARVPTGTAARIVEERSYERYGPYTYYARCTVDLGDRRRTAFGPVPYRPPTGRGEPSALQYPTTGLCFQAWLWREEVQRARRLGISVAVHDGWTWERWDTDNRAWIDDITTLRREARHPIHEDWLKLASVAAIGRHNQKPLKYEIVWHDDPRLSEEDIPLPSRTPGEPPITGAFLHCEPDTNPPPRLPHLFNYVTMRCRVELYDRMEAERRAGNTVLQTDFDAIILEQASTLPTGEAIGEWRQRKRTNVEIPGTRAFQSDEVTRLPGVKRDKRESHED